MLETVETLMKLKMSADDGYYVGKPIMSDAEYDKLKEKIQELLEDDQNLKVKFWEEFKKPSTSRLLENSLGDIRHLFPMTSLDKSNNIDLLMKEIAKWRAHGSNSFVLMWKIDGASGGFRFEEGFLSSTLTRHERDIGKDLTFTGQQILNLPKQISDQRFYEVRGEMLIFADDLEEVNKLRVERGERPYMNARNAAAGISQTKDASKVRDLRLSVIAYDVFTTEGDFESHAQKLGWLSMQGFTVPEYVIVPTQVSKETLQELLQKFEDRRFSLGYDVDGMVAMVNECEVRDDLGYTSEVPDYAFAFKFKDVELSFDIDDSEFEHGIEWCFGMTGVITPRAHFKPHPLSVEIFGVNITHATLHNVAELRKIGWTTSSRKAMVKRAGMVIPKVVSTITENEDLVFPTPPEYCPHCKSKLEFRGEIYQCVNADCSGKSFTRLVKFVSSMGIDDLGETRLMAIVEDGLLSDPPSPADLYSLKVEDLAKLDRMGDSISKKIVDNIQQSKDNPLRKVLAGLLIRSLGETTSKNCEKEWKTLSNFFANVSAEKLTKMDKVGSIIAESIMSGLRVPEMEKTIRSLIALGVGENAPVEEKNFGIFENKTFCLTGSPTLNGVKMKKKDVEEKIIKAGGTIASGVVKGLDYLVAGQDSIDEKSNKITKAEKFGVTVLTVAELFKLLGE